MNHHRDADTRGQRDEADAATVEAVAAVS
ncbi:MAG: hypothetical protein QOK02_789, partial [Mycobacterium sp.]|nr:hypothetical protein [Mycobacterium sp.]